MEVIGKNRKFVQYFCKIPDTTCKCRSFYATRINLSRSEITDITTTKTSQYEKALSETRSGSNPSGGCPDYLRSKEVTKVESETGIGYGGGSNQPARVRAAMATNGKPGEIKIRLAN